MSEIPPFLIGKERLRRRPSRSSTLHMPWSPADLRRRKGLLTGTKKPSDPCAKRGRDGHSSLLKKHLISQTFSNGEKRCVFRTTTPQVFRRRSLSQHFAWVFFLFLSISQNGENSSTSETQVMKRCPAGEALLGRRKLAPKQRPTPESTSVQ